MKKYSVGFSLAFAVFCVNAQDLKVHIDTEIRYEAQKLTSHDGGTWVRMQFENDCTEGLFGYSKTVEKDWQTLPCEDAAQGEVSTLPEQALVIRGDHRSAMINDKEVNFVIADSSRVILLEIEPGTYSFRAGHLRTFRIEIPAISIQKGDSIVISMTKTFVSVLDCHTSRIDPEPPPDLRAEYLARREDELYWRVRGHTASTCYRNLYDFLYSLPLEYR